ncbi:MAG: hypothetical protein K0S09_2936 [Sphingobacteriaceae bacterium]|jgi:hypothetical protein|nr:hypothetical protein [Sphingobacteriaceae bacterium]
MIKIFKNIFLVSFILASGAAVAQTTSSSPYSQFGMGILRGPFLPQNRAMGNISAGVKHIGIYNNINMANPASYANVRMTTFDIGAFTGLTQLSNSTTKQGSNFNGSLSHIAFAIPVTKKSAMSFGLLPYSDFGYKYRNTTSVTVGGTAIPANLTYSGNGGISKAYLGYGFQLGKHINIGANGSFLFGKLAESSATEFANTDGTFLNSRTEKRNSISGLNFDYGIQYTVNPTAKNRLTIGYSGSSGNKISSRLSSLTTRYGVNSQGEESAAFDTTFFQQNAKSDLKLPSAHTIGFTFENSNKWLLGADLVLRQWSDYRLGATNPGMQNSIGLNVGGQYTPDVTAISSKYLSLIDYRLGIRYEKTGINLKSTDILDRALTFGFGFPLQSARTAFYKINFSTELGQRGTTQNNLIRERYVNFSLGFTLNDQWFQKFKFD